MNSHSATISVTETFVTQPGQRLRMLAVLLLVLGIPSVTRAHPFHTSIAEMEWNPRTHCFEVAMRVNSLELERALKVAGYGSINLDRIAESEEAVEDYVADRVSVSCLASPDGARRDCTMNWVGMELEKLDLWIYFELQDVEASGFSGSSRPGIEIRPATTVSEGQSSSTQLSPYAVAMRNTLLMDLNPLQVNFANVIVGETTVSAHFTAAAPEASLKLDAQDSTVKADDNAKASSADVPPPAEMKRDIFIRFEADGADANWEPTDKTAWSMDSENGNSFYALTKKRSDFSPRFRSPFNRSLLKGHEYSSFVLDVKVRSTIPDYNHRDLCVFFGYQDDDHLYYVHLGKRTDDHANQIFIVNDAPRTKISEKTTEGIPWDDEWHHVRVERDAESGRIAVYFDDLSEPVMTATDRTFRSGRVGIGSFDDTGHFDDFSVWVPQTD